MKLILRAVEDRDEALSLAPDLEDWVRASQPNAGDDELPAGALTRFIERYFDAPQTLLLLAEDPGEGKRWGLCLTGPLEEPLEGRAHALLLALFVVPELRHRGVARTLVDEAERMLVACGQRGLAARAAHNDDAPISMGERWGFLRSWEFMHREGEQGA